MARRRAGRQAYHSAIDVVEHANVGGALCVDNECSAPGDVHHDAGTMWLLYAVTGRHAHRTRSSDVLGAVTTAFSLYQAGENIRYFLGHDVAAGVSLGVQRITRMAYTEARGFQATHRFHSLRLDRRAKVAACTQPITNVPGA